MTLPLLSVSDGVLSIPLKGIEFVMAGSTLIYNIVQKEREEEKICEKFIFQIPIDAFSKQFAKYITYAVRSFLRLWRHPGKIDFKLTTSDVFRIFGGVDLFRLSVFFVVKYFSFFCQISWFTSVCFLLCFCLYWYSPKSSRAVTLFYRVAVCSVFASFAQFLRLLLCLLSVLPDALCILNWISD